jgi:hypothetical protein
MTTDTKDAGPVTHGAAGAGKSRKAFDAKPWSGATRQYDIVKEFVIAMVVVGLLAVGLSLIFSSPDDKSITLKSWGNAAPSDFVATAASELAGTSGTAGYGQPYNATPDATQKIGPLDLQKLAGVRIPIDTVKDFVIGPLEAMPALDSTKTALAAWTAASADQQAKWAGDYGDAIAKAPDGDYTKVAAGDFGPVPALTGALLAAAQGGALDGVMSSQGHFFNTDYTYSLLFIADGTYLEDQARAQHLGGDQWGMTNETGSYPGQSWLWLYTFWYQIDPFASSDNADALVWALMMLLTLGLLVLPLIPGLRDIPRWIPVHRLIWRDYYRARQTRKV